MSEVIDLKTRKPFALARAEERKQKRSASRKAKKQAADAVMEHRDAMIEVLEGLLKMTREGHLEGLVLFSRDTKHKIFLTEVVLDDRVIPPNDLHAFVGVMETLKLEIADMAAATAPALLLSGERLDPTANPPEEEWEYE
ncbi:hypothetical protein HJA82_28965 [Rhizobium bangladeshense]|uniref:hypothetical protein n=1 Tax=Rhizobium TaxID=379 RepID=UPI001C83C88C|nr:MULTISPECIES: hypothetical protein [Rhizobium]MBX4911345.1 hypothetical protein [Rhizobium bangladeshense]MBX5130805.1 hypothetical protein [Rhizobium lentis]